MTTEPRSLHQQPDQDPGAVDWADLACRPDSEREDYLQRFYAQLAELPEPTRLARLRTMVDATYALPDDEFRALTAGRLRAWLRLDGEAATRVAQSYDAVLRELPAGAAMRRVAVVQTLMRDLSEDDQRRLRELNPEERARGLVLTKLDSFAERADDQP